MGIFELPIRREYGTKHVRGGLQVDATHTSFLLVTVVAKPKQYLQENNRLKLLKKVSGFGDLHKITPVPAISQLHCRWDTIRHGHGRSPDIWLRYSVPLSCTKTQESYAVETLSVLLTQGFPSLVAFKVLPSAFQVQRVTRTFETLLTGCHKFTRNKSVLAREHASVVK